MIKFKSLSGKNVLSYKKFDIKFEDRIYRIFGKNLDTSDEHGLTGNAVGKTLLWSAGLASPLYFQTPLSLTKGRGAKELLSKKSLISLAFDKYKINQTSKGFDIFENGQDLEVRTVPLAKAKIRKLFPLTEEEFYTTAYITSQRPYLIQQSTDLKRIDLFTNLFQLNDYSKLRDVFAQKLRSVKDDEIKAGIHTQNMRDSKKRLKDLPKVDKEALTANKVRLESLNKNKLALDTDIANIEVDLRHLQSVQSIDSKLEALRPKYIHKGNPRDVLKRLKKEREQEVEYKRYAKDLQEYKEEKEECEKQLASLPDASIADLEKVIDKCQDKIDKKEIELNKIRRIIENEEEQEERNEAIVSKLKSLGFILKDVPKKDVTEQLALYKSVLSLEKLLHEHEDGNCPTCNSEIDINKIKKQVKAAKENIPKLEAIVKAQKLKEGYVKPSGEADRDYFEALNEEISAEKEKKKKAKAKLESAKERAKIEKQLANLEKPEKVEKPEWSYNVKEQIEIVEEIVECLNSKRALLEKSSLDENSTVKDVAKEVDRLNFKLKAYKRDLARVEEKQTELVDDIDKDLAVIKERSLVKQEYLKAKKFLTDLAENLRRRKLYEALVKCYSPKGLKIFVLKGICALIEQNFNHYASLVFGENFKFDIHVSTKGISIQVTRPNKQVSDVRNLSGAESDSFILLCLISVLPILPDNRRTNLVVLDEPLSHSDEASRIRIIKNFIPALHAVVPNIIFISNTPEQVTGSVNLLVTKKNGRSTLSLM